MRQAAVVGALSLLLAALSGLAYFPILSYDFTGADTLTLIDTGRLQSPGDALRLFGKPLMAESSFTQSALFFRPLAMLSFGLDHLAWQLNPYGYHLTDLLLHTVVSLVAFWLMRLLTGSTTIAWLGAALFTIHPVIVEVVPANARRQDTLAALFVTLSIALFLVARRQRQAGGRARLTSSLSLMAYAAALGSKEVGIVTPVMIAAYVLVSSFDGGTGRLRARALGALEACRPYVGVTLVYLAWRLLVLKDVGGYLDEPWGLSAPLEFWTSTPSRYVRFLTYPDHPLGSLLIERLRLALLVVLALGIASGAVESRRAFGGAPVRARRIHTLMLMAAAGAGLLLLYGVGFPIIVEALRRLGAQSLADAADGFGQTSRILVWPVAGAAGLLLLAAADRGRVVELLRQSRRLRVAIMLVVWLFTPLALYLLTHTFSRRDMYLPAIWFCALLALMLGESIRALRRSLRLAGTHRTAPVMAAAGGGAISSAMFVYLVAVSPLFQPYDEWRAGASLASAFRHELSSHTENLTTALTLRLQGIPSGIEFPPGGSPRVRTYLSARAVTSWLNLTQPGHQLEIVIEDRSVLTGSPRDIRLEIAPGAAGELIVVAGP